MLDQTEKPYSFPTLLLCYRILQSWFRIGPFIRLRPHECSSVVLKGQEELGLEFFALTKLGNEYRMSILIDSESTLALFIYSMDSLKLETKRSFSP